MDVNEPVTVYTVNNPYEAEIIKMALRREGIHCELDGEGQAGFSDIFPVGILVPAKDADLARDVITQSTANQNAAANDEVDS